MPADIEVWIATHKRTHILVDPQTRQTGHKSLRYTHCVQICTHVDVAARVVLHQLARDVLAGLPGRLGHLGVVLPVAAGGVRVQGGGRCVRDTRVRHNARRLAYTHQYHSLRLCSQSFYVS